MAGLIPIMLSTGTGVDLVAIAPFFLASLGVDLRFLRVLRLFRMFRILKLGRYSSALQAFGRVFSRTRAELALVGFTLLVVLILVSSLMYLVEGKVQPELFSSIPAAMWWSIVTLTTVGYGDTVPITELGRVLGALVAIAGIGLYALPTGILGAAFVQEMREERNDNAPVKKQDLD
jgi:voltage-gated potassium channel